MDPWDEYIFADDAVVDFLDELSDLDDDDIIEAVADACTLAVRDARISEEEKLQGQAAATIAAIWAGAPYSAGDVVTEYPFIRRLIGRGDEDLNASAATIFEDLDGAADVDSFVEALASAD